MALRPLDRVGRVLDYSGIQVFPVKTNQFIQTKTFRTGGWFSQEDKIPTRLYFDLDQKTQGFSLGLPKS